MKKAEVLCAFFVVSSYINLFDFVPLVNMNMVYLGMSEREIWIPGQDETMRASRKFDEDWSIVNNPKSSKKEWQKSARSLINNAYNFRVYLNIFKQKADEEIYLQEERRIKLIYEGRAHWRDIKDETKNY